MYEPDDGMYQGSYFCCIEQIGLQIEGSVLVKYTGKSRTLEIPAGITEIFDGALKDNLVVSSVTIPEGVTVIGEEAFSGCRYLKTVTIPSTVEEIYENAFYGCVELEKVVLPSKLKKIRKFVFGYCNSLYLAREECLLHILGVYKIRTGEVNYTHAVTHF